MLELGGKEGRVAGFVGTDPLRLTVSFEGGLGGYEADDMLIEGAYVGYIGSSVGEDKRCPPFVCLKRLTARGKRVIAGS